jgi:hypothetical protein
MSVFHIAVFSVAGVGTPASKQPRISFFELCNIFVITMSMTGG